MQADIMQKYVHHQNAFVTTVSFVAAQVLPLHALILNIGKQPGMHPPLLGVTLCLKITRAHLMPVTGHESNGCPHPRTTDGKLVSTQISRVVALNCAKASNATIVRALVTSRRTARRYVLAVPVLAVDVATLAANRVI